MHDRVGSDELVDQIEIAAAEALFEEPPNSALLALVVAHRRIVRVRGQADQPSRDRPIAIDTAAWLGSTTGRPTWRCRRSR